MRLEKVVANQSGLSRREARQAIRRGRVSVDERVVREPALAVGSSDSVLLDGALLRLCRRSQFAF